MPRPAGPKMTPAATNTSGAVKTVPSSRRETRPKTKTTVASTARSTTVGSRNVEPTRTKVIRQGRFFRRPFAVYVGGQHRQAGGYQRSDHADALEDAPGERVHYRSPATTHDHTVPTGHL